MNVKKKRVVALGFFDGVHLGHGELLKSTKSLAAELGVTPSVLTYLRHPSEVLSDTPVRLINTVEERCAIISELYGIDDIVVRAFDPEYASLSCEDFVDKILVSELSAVGVCAGYDFRFGKGGKGDAELLLKLCRERDIECRIIEKVTLDGEVISSSGIRKLLENGEIARANKLLGHYHCIMSVVEHGKALGRTLDFPTANQALPKNAVVPKCGVYITKVTVDGSEFKGVTNIGMRPTVESGAAPRLETYILDFFGDIYGEKIKVELVCFLREEKKFASVELLKKQIVQDAECARCAKV